MPRLSVLAAPAAGILAMTTFNSSLMRYLVEKHLGAAELGIFAAMTYWRFAGMTIIKRARAGPHPSPRPPDANRRLRRVLVAPAEVDGVSAVIGAGFIFLPSSGVVR